MEACSDSDVLRAGGRKHLIKNRHIVDEWISGPAHNS